MPIGSGSARMTGEMTAPRALRRSDVVEAARIQHLACAGVIARQQRHRLMQLSQPCRHLLQTKGPRFRLISGLVDVAGMTGSFSQPTEQITGGRPDAFARTAAIGESNEPA